jgi:uncharacterized membrane protein HdeD (DUF308 family)
LIVGVLAVVLGGSLVFRPFASLAALMFVTVVGLVLLAIGEWSADPANPDRRIARAKAPDLLSWTQDRLDGKRAPDNC